MNEQLLNDLRNLAKDWRKVAPTLETMEEAIAVVRNCAASLDDILDEFVYPPELSADIEDDAFVKGVTGIAVQISD